MKIDASLAMLIKEVLAEELSSLKDNGAGSSPLAKSTVREEIVSILSDADLNAFVMKLLDKFEDKSRLQEIRQGRFIFKLAGKSGGSTPIPTLKPALDGATVSSSSVVDIETGFLSERHVDQLSGAVKRARLGKRVKMTPLARDRFRQRGIAIERIE
jgi:hypothetical protein